MWHYFLLITALACIASAGSVTQCPDETKAGCSPPKWSWDYSMANSGYTYCYNQCPLPWLKNNTQLGLFGGVVGFDHYYTKQGMPCINGVPQEFEMQNNITRETKATFPKAKVLQYRITDAVPYDAVVHDKMVTDPDFFIRWHHAPNANGSICQVPHPEHKTEGFNCSWEIRAAAYDWSQEKVRDWYLENIIHPTMVYADGAWIDGDGPDNGAYQCSGSYKFGELPAPYPALNATEVGDFCAGEASVVTQAQQWLIANGGFDYNCFSFIPDTNRLPQQSDSSQVCSSKIKALSALNPSSGIVLYGSRTAGSGYTDETTAQAVATFMLVRGGLGWYFGLPSADSLNATAAKYFLADYGAATSVMTEKSPNVYERTFEKATVSLDCNTFTAAFTAQ